jgi:hypothetical protein
MKGATALDSVNTISIPSKRRIMIIGNNQNFFLAFKNPQNSLDSPITFPFKIVFRNGEQYSIRSASTNNANP